MEGQRLRVLWVDDDPVLTKELPGEAYDFGLDLKPFLCWDEAEPELDAKFECWDAIILDAKCKHHRNSNAQADKFLIEALTAISRICAVHGRQIPWYILSAGGAEVGPIENYIPEERKKWDGEDWDNSHNGRNYYLKTTTECEMLYSRIRYQANNLSQLTQLKSTLYRDVYDAIRVCKLDEEVEWLLGDLLCPIHFDVKLRTENQLMWANRKSLEYIFRSLIEHWEILPSSLIGKTGKDDINLTAASKLLSGYEVTLDTKVYKPTAPIVDKIISENIKNILYITGSYLHTGGEDPTQKFYRTADHLTKVHNAPYLIRSCAFALCDVILWMSDFIQSHPNPEENRTLITITETSTL